jgi:hypothetical protein
MLRFLPSRGLEGVFVSRGWSWTERFGQHTRFRGWQKHSMPGKESESRLVLLVDTQSWDQKGTMDVRRGRHAHQIPEGR